MKNSEAKNFRLAMSVSKKLGNAVVRNHQKRLIRQVFTKYKSEIAYGPLFEGYAVCGGYTDLMELFLEKMNIKSYKIIEFEGYIYE